MAAPSVHNVQPARWRIENDALLLIEDMSRRLAVGDPTGNDAAISLGAAAEGLRIAASRAELVAIESRSELPAATDALRPVARFRFEPEAAIDPLAEWLDQRASWRGNFLPPTEADRTAAATLEADDAETISAALEIVTDLPVDVILVPPGEPRTKPRALNYGMQFAEGELVTIYDAEDHPDPLQLRRAVAAFRRVGPKYACLQARLSFYGGQRNLLTKWFTTDYFTWFRLYLPGLSSMQAPIPLGGTSNHFRRDVLAAAGGWDPWNVTEDAELGIRLQRTGHRVGVLDSVTMEEPNIDVVNWVKQRSRWYKGYLQTTLELLRHPRDVVADLGRRDSWRVALFVGGTPLLAVLNLWFWGLSAFWFMTRATFVGELFPGWTYYLALAAWGLGNLSVIYIGLLTLRVVGRPEFLLSALLVPLYWLLMSLAALRAVVQLVTQPSYWEKTEHGLFDPDDTPELAPHR